MLTNRDLLAPAPPDLQLLQLIQPLNALVVDQRACLPQLQVDHLDAIPPTALRQSGDPLAQLGITVRARLVAKRACAHARQGQATAFRQPLRLHPPHQLPTKRCGYHCLRSASLVASFSSSASAKCFLSLVFSSSSHFRHFGIRDIHAASHVPPGVVARFRVPVLAAQLLHRPAPLSLLQEPADLLFRIPLLYVQSPSPGVRLQITLLIKRGGTSATHSDPHQWIESWLGN
jgi:hypothetical protein